MSSNRYAYQILVKLQFSQHISEKYSNLNLVIIYQLEPCCSMQTDGGMDGRTEGRTDRHDVANSRFYSFFTVLRRA
jgi:hypothetical protein